MICRVIVVGMAAMGASFANVQRNYRGFTTILTSAACEWFLIFLLFVDAALSYLLTKFACYCELQIPCILCSRLDNVLWNEKPDFYRNLLCSNHRSEISSLISCHIHGKLADVHGMCEDCLLSFATENKPNSEMYRLLVGKLGMDIGSCGFQNPLLNKDFVPGSLSTRPCSCCNKPWKSRQNAQRLLQLKPIGVGFTKPNVPLPRLPGRNRLNRRDSLKRIRDKFSGSVTSHCLGNNGIDPLSHVGYTELKITSDSESEVPFSDDDDGINLVREKNDLKEDVAVQCGLDVLPKALSGDLAPAKLTHQASNPGPSLLDQCVQSDVSKPHDANCLASDVTIGHGLEELNWQQADQKSNPPAPSQLISLDDIPQSSNIVEVPVGVSKEECKLKVPLSQKSSSSALSELISLDDIPASFNVVEAPVGVSLEKKSIDVTGISDTGHASMTEHGEVFKSTITETGAGFKTDQVLNVTAPSMLNFMDPSDACKLAGRNEGREASGLLAEQLAAKDSARVNEDLKSTLSQISFARGIDRLLNNTSPRVFGHDDELQITDASSSDGIQMLQNSVSMERNESGNESMDGSIASYIDGESIVDWLKQQVEYDRRRMSALYKELDEERSASAVAANQAMAMITRLQEEKAALHMEALQYLRMMEEQAEYDVEALEKANDLLAEKEKDIQDLEAELEIYRSKFPDESMVDDLNEETCDLKGKNIMVENRGVQCSESNADVPYNSMFTKKSEGSDKPINVMCSFLDFKDEKLYISQCLKKLEGKLHQFTCNGASADMPNGGYSEKVADGIKYQEELLTTEGSQLNHWKEENGLSMRKDSSVSNGSPPTQEGFVASAGDYHFVRKENNHFDSDGQKFPVHCREVDLVVIENEVSDLNDRLEALEADRDFLEHTFNSLQNGSEGLQFIQEIAQQLQELRNIGIRKRCPSVP